jgi:hypothetical protein
VHGVGRIHVRAGRPVHASIDGLIEDQPHKAFYRMLTWTEGTFSLRPFKDHPFDNELRDSMQLLLLDGLRHCDEGRRLLAALPEPDAILMQAAAVRQGSLTPVEKQVIELSLKVKTVGAIIDGSTATDLEAAAALHGLLKRGILAVVD